MSPHEGTKRQLTDRALFVRIRLMRQQAYFYWHAVLPPQTCRWRPQRPWAYCPMPLVQSVTSVGVKPRIRTHTSVGIWASSSAAIHTPPLIW